MVLGDGVSNLFIWWVESWRVNAKSGRLCDENRERESDGRLSQSHCMNYHMGFFTSSCKDRTRRRHSTK